MAESFSTEQYIEKFQKRDELYLRQVRKLKEQVRNDESLSDLDRAVLGSTGSAEELELYKKIASKVGHLAGQPIIRLTRVQGEKVVEAEGGLIAGPVEAELSHTAHTTKRFYSSSLSVPVSPSLAWWASRGSGRAREEERTFFDEANSMYDRDRQVGSLVIANINAYQNTSRKVMTPDQDFEHRIDIDTILVGREEIYTSPYFENGVNRVLLALEKRARVEEQAAA
jgi:hypothetical protein